MTIRETAASLVARSSRANSKTRRSPARTPRTFFRRDGQRQSGGAAHHHPGPKNTVAVATLASIS
jgi:hypothetical protein